MSFGNMLESQDQLPPATGEAPAYGMNNMLESQALYDSANSEVLAPVTANNEVLAHSMNSESVFESPALFTSATGEASQVQYCSPTAAQRQIISGTPPLLVTFLY